MIHPTSSETFFNHRFISLYYKRLQNKRPKRPSAALCSHAAGPPGNSHTASSGNICIFYTPTGQKCPKIRQQPALGTESDAYAAKIVAKKDCCTRQTRKSDGIPLQDQQNLCKLRVGADFGGVAKRTKATVCKTVIRRFESDRRL